MNASETRTSTWRTALSTVVALILLGIGASCAFALLAFPPAKWPPGFRQSLGLKVLEVEEEEAGHAAHGETESLKLSAAAWKNLGLRTGVVATSNYQRTVPVPATVVERSGRSRVAVTAPFTGIVTRVYPIEGEAVEPGQPLFDLRLTHEDLVTSQREFLRSAEELEVINREIARLESVGEGVSAGKQIVTQKYERDKLAAALHAQRQGLLLHGLSSEQIDAILDSRELLKTLTIAVPAFDTEADHHDLDHLYHVQQISAARGEQVDAGAPLATLADHCLLYVEGQAFEDDAERLTQAARENWSVRVEPVAAESRGGEPEQLQVLYVADRIDSESRALRFYMSLPNEPVRDQRQGEHRFVSWKYRPGQRLQVHVPIGDPWVGQIVLPREAVVEEGAEAFVFEQNGDSFERVPVHVLYRDQEAVVVENSGALLGSTLAMSGAYRMHLAILNQASGGAANAHGHAH